jgi:hypothetical protein
MDLILLLMRKGGLERPPLRLDGVEGEEADVLLSAHSLPFIIGLRTHTNRVISWLHP